MTKQLGVLILDKADWLLPESGPGTICEDDLSPEALYVHMGGFDCGEGNGCQDRGEVIGMGFGDGKGFGWGAARDGIRNEL